MDILASGILGNLPTDLKQGLLIVAIALLVIATIGLIVNRAHSQKED